VKPKILYYTGWTIGRIISKGIFRITVSGQEHIPGTGGFILATNHKSYFDPLFIGSWSPRQLYYFAKSELWKNKIFGAIISRTNALPVKRGAVDRTALDLSLNTIAHGNGLVIFPEGTRSLSDKFLEPKPGIGLIAARARCPIIPGYIHGTNALKECFLGRRQMSITFGPAISPLWIGSQPFDKEGYMTIARKVMGEIEKLKNEKNNK